MLIVDPGILPAVHLNHKFNQKDSVVPTVAPTLQSLSRAVTQLIWSAAVVETLLEDGDATSAVTAIIEKQIPVIVTSLKPRNTLPKPLVSCSFIRKHTLPQSSSTDWQRSYRGRLSSAIGRSRLRKRSGDCRSRCSLRRSLVHLLTPQDQNER